MWMSFQREAAVKWKDRPFLDADVSGTMDAITSTGKITPEQVDTILTAWKAFAGGESNGIQ